MKIRQLIDEAKKGVRAVKHTVKPRDPNWGTMQAKRTSGAAGSHGDKKKAMKQGDVKHKSKAIEVDEDSSTIVDKVKDAVTKVGDTISTTLPQDMRPFDNQTASNFSKNISKPKTVNEATRNPDMMSQTDYDRYQQGQMDSEKRNFKRDEMEHELGDEDRGMYWVVIAKNGKWEHTKAQPRQEGMNAAQRIIDSLHAKYPSMHLGMMGPDGKVYNMGKGR